MSASAPTPEPTGLSAEQRRVLDDLAAHENAADPGYVLRMNAPGRGPDATTASTAAHGRRWDLWVQAAVVAVILAVVLPVAWTIALVLTAALVVGPTYLVLTALRDGGLEPPAARGGPSGPAGPSDGPHRG